MLKARFPILKTTSSYPLIKQRFIVFAACAVHNFIRKFDQEDWLFRDVDLGRMDNENEELDVPSVQNFKRVVRGRREMGTVSDDIFRG